jgi:hypothetical protein
MMRMRRAPLFFLCDTPEQRGLLFNTIHCCIEEQVAMLLHIIVSHNERNTVIAKKKTSKDQEK